MKCIIMTNNTYLGKNWNFVNFVSFIEILYRWAIEYQNLLIKYNFIINSLQIAVCYSISQTDRRMWKINYSGE